MFGYNNIYFTLDFYNIFSKKHHLNILIVSNHLIFDMLKEGIIDPKKVARVALENAASVAGMILTTECALIDIKEETPPAPPMGGGGMPGMM